MADGRTLDEAIEWLSEKLRTHAGAPLQRQQLRALFLSELRDSRDDDWKTVLRAARQAAIAKRDSPTSTTAEKAAANVELNLIVSLAQQMSQTL